MQNLNDKQQEAVRADDAALLILAGAGSGKTKVLTAKITHLITEKGVLPWNIIAFTFTNKAAKEMRDRVKAQWQQDVSGMWIGTFHSLCSRILRRHIDLLGYTSRFTIYDSSDQRGLVKRIMKELFIDDRSLTPYGVLSMISMIKNGGEKPFNVNVLRIYEQYEKTKKRNNALDFDDLLLKTLELFKKHPDVLQKYQRQFTHIFVDEYQDTNRVQYDLIRMLYAKGSKICVVGDQDQSIYGWRGADISNIIDFEKDFPKTRVILLEQNYRSTKNVLNAANVLIKNNGNRKDKNLWTENEKGEPVEYRLMNNDLEEAQFVTNRIRLYSENGGRYGDCAILYRTNAQSRPFEDALIRSGIAYRVVGGLKFYDRAEIKDLVAYMNLTANPLDDVSFLRIANVPRRGLGDKSIEDLKRAASQMDASLLEMLLEEDLFSALSVSQQKKWREFRDLMRTLEKLSTGAITDFVQAVYQLSGYEKMLTQSRLVEDESRRENIDQFFSAIADYEEETEDANLSDYLQNLSLMSELDKTKEASDAVSLMTVHGAKGLEFPFVFIVGMEEGLFPGKRALEEGSEEEERRLFYVALTRAEKKLVISAVKSRRTYGQSMPQMPSRFIGEIEEVLETPKRTAVSFDTDLRDQYEKNRERIRKIVKEKKAAFQGSYRVGDKVRHKRFGDGMVVSVMKGDEGDMVTVAFDKRGIKRLDSRTAPLEII